MYNIYFTMFNLKIFKNYKANEKHVHKNNKMKDTLQRGSARKWASHLNSMPFADSIPDSTEKSNPQT